MPSFAKSNHCALRAPTACFVRKKSASIRKTRLWIKAKMVWSGFYTRSSIACGRLLVRAQSTIRADGPPSAQACRKLLIMMLELKEKVFAQLNGLTFEEVQARISRGEHLGDPQIVREWLELHAPERPDRKSTRL